MGLIINDRSLKFRESINGANVIKGEMMVVCHVLLTTDREMAVDLGYYWR